MKPANQPETTMTEIADTRPDAAQAWLPGLQPDQAACVLTLQVREIGARLAGEEDETSTDLAPPSPGEV